MTIGLLVMAGTVQAASTFINTCPVVFTPPGDYLLRADLICGGGGGIDVVLGSKIRILGPGLITNGGGNSFVTGVNLGDANSSEVSAITVLASSGAGIRAVNGDILTITANTLGRNSQGILMNAVHFSTISGNDASGNSFGRFVDNTGPPNNPLGTVSRNIFTGNASTGLELDIVREATVQNNVTNGNGVIGIVVRSIENSQATNNASLANGGFDLSDTVPGCTETVWSGNTFFTANQSCIH
jgi:nitrous oxidase accessory protein NosD